MYSAYIREKTNKSILETKHGFATFSFPDVNTVYIEDIYILPESRKSKEASELADRIAEIGKSKGCNRLLGSVVPSTKNSTDSIKVLLAYGMHLDSATNDFILFKKEIV